MKKTAIRVLLCIAMVLCLAGCGKDKEQKNTTPEENNQSAEGGSVDGTNYVGMTVNEFVETGAELTGYTGINGKYEFTAANDEKKEKYTFYLEDAVKEKMDSMELGESYIDYIGDLKIKEMKVVTIDVDKAKECIGKTVSEMKEEGYIFNGHIIANGSVSLYATLDGTTITVYLDSSASKVYENNSDTYSENEYSLFDDCKVEDVQVMMY